MNTSKGFSLDSGKRKRRDNMLIIDNIIINNKKLYAISNLTTSGKQLLKICDSLEQAKNEKISRII